MHGTLDHERRERWHLCRQCVEGCVASQVPLILPVIALLTGFHESGIADVIHSVDQCGRIFNEVEGGGHDAQGLQQRLFPAAVLTGTDRVGGGRHQTVFSQPLHQRDIDVLFFNGDDIGFAQRVIQFIDGCVDIPCANQA